MTKLNYRVLYHHRTQAQGAEGNHIRGMIDGFSSIGCEVDIVGPPGVNPYGFRDPFLPHGKGLTASLLGKLSKVAPEPFFETLELIYNALAWRKVAASIRRSRYDFIYERYALNSFAGVSLASRKKVPLVLEVNDATVIERSRPLFFANVARRIEREVFMRASLIVTISNKFKDLIVSNYKYPAEKILVLPNAIDPARFDLERLPRVSRSAIGIPEEATVIGCAGAFVPWHGLDLLIESIASHVRTHNLFLLFIGDGPVRNLIENLGCRHNIDDRIYFTGFVPADQVPSYLDILNICIIPDSNAHGSPMKLFEFMAMGKPIVLPRYEPLLEIAEDGKDAIFFKPRDPDSMLQAVTKLLGSIDLRKKLGDNARSTVLRKFTWGRNCVQVLRALGMEETL